MKFPHRRQFLHLAAGAAALPAMMRVARAQAYPTRPVRFIVPVAAGGSTDVAARAIGEYLSRSFASRFMLRTGVAREASSASRLPQKVHRMVTPFSCQLIAWPARRMS